MASVNVNTINVTVKSALSDYTRIIFTSEAELASLRESKKNAAETLDALKGCIALGAELPEGFTSDSVSEYEKKVNSLSEKMKAVRAYQTSQIFGIHKKNTEEVDGIADYFRLPKLYEFAVDHASANGEINGYVERIAEDVREMFPEDTKINLINKFARSLAVKVGVSEVTRGKKILKGILAEDVNYKKFVLSFLGNFAQKMSVTEKTGVRLYNSEGYTWSVEYDTTGGAVKVSSMVVSAIEDAKEEKSEEAAA